ncbi:hypothetical protein SAMN05216176_11147 [Nitratireductor indicus]|nr:hypothetical protein SAMN05216176_11147 [Nitratireductor indicus]
MLAAADFARNVRLSLPFGVFGTLLALLFIN